MSTDEENGRSRHWYHVELRTGDEVRDLGHVPDAFPHHDSLTPFVSRLLREGATGEVILIDDESGQVVARRRLEHGLQRRGRQSESR
jgi:hypothetical protein